MACTALDNSIVMTAERSQKSEVKTKSRKNKKKEVEKNDRKKKKKTCNSKAAKYTVGDPAPDNKSENPPASKAETKSPGVNEKSKILDNKVTSLSLEVDIYPTEKYMRQQSVEEDLVNVEW